MRRIKCPECLGCMIQVWVLPKMYWHCSLCNLYYRILDGKLTLTEVTVEELQRLE